MAKPEPKDPFQKAPRKEHPLAPDEAPQLATVRSQSTTPQVMHSALIDQDVKLRLAIYKARSGRSFGDLTNEALIRFLDDAESQES